jgi:aryl-alcohol dehydrogenase-like predicted oxidoreductase
MRYKLLGRSGLRVSELALGAMTFGEDWGWGAHKEESKRVFDAYAEAGGNFIDTANIYTNGTSEILTGEFIASDRAHFVLATKYTLNMRGGDPNFSGNHRKNMVQSVEASLKRLKTDYIDLYWVHAWDALTPTEEIMRGLDDLVRAGKVIYVGISDAPAWFIAEANMMAELRGWSRFVAMQLQYSLIDRSIEREHLPLARINDIAVTPWAVLGRGILSGKYNKDSKSDGRAAMQDLLTDEKLKVAQAVIDVAKAIGRTPAQVATNWVRQQPGVIIPIVGARTHEQLVDNLGALDFTLSAEHLAQLSAASPIDLGFPYSFLQMPYVQDLVYGGVRGQIDHHRPA